MAVGALAVHGPAFYLSASLAARSSHRARAAASSARADVRRELRVPAPRPRRRAARRSRAWRPSCPRPPPRRAPPSRRSPSCRPARSTSTRSTEGLRRIPPAPARTSRASSQWRAIASRSALRAARAARRSRPAPRSRTSSGPSARSASSAASRTPPSPSASARPGERQRRRALTAAEPARARATAAMRTAGRLVRGERAPRAPGPPRSLPRWPSTMAACARTLRDEPSSRSARTAPSICASARARGGEARGGRRQASGAHARRELTYARARGERRRCRCAATYLRAARPTAAPATPPERAGAAGRSPGRGARPRPRRSPSRVTGRISRMVEVMKTSSARSRSSGRSGDLLDRDALGASEPQHHPARHPLQDPRGEGRRAHAPSRDREDVRRRTPRSRSPRVVEEQRLVRPGGARLPDGEHVRQVRAGLRGRDRPPAARRAARRR